MGRISPGRISPDMGSSAGVNSKLQQLDRQVQAIANLSKINENSIDSKSNAKLDSIS